MTTLQVSIKNSLNQAAFLIHVVTAARYVRIVTEHDEGAGTGRGFAPRKMRVAIGAQADMAFGSGNAERMDAGNHGAVGKTGAAQMHDVVSPE